MFTQASTFTFHFDDQDLVPRFDQQDDEDIKRLNEAFMYSTIKHGDYINDQFIWDEYQGAVPLSYSLSDYGHVPPSFALKKFGRLDPYHWHHLSDYFWLNDDLKKSLSFTKDPNGHFVSPVTINNRDYVVIVDDVERLIEDDKCILHPNKMVFMTQEREFEGEIEHQSMFDMPDGAKLRPGQGTRSVPGTTIDGKRFKTNKTFPTFQDVPCFFLTASEEPLEFNLSRPTIWTSPDAPLVFGDVVFVGDNTYQKWDGDQLFSGTPTIIDNAPIPGFGPYHWDLFQLDSSDFTLGDSIMQRLVFTPIGTTHPGFFALVTINGIEYVCLSAKAPRDNLFNTSPGNAFDRIVRMIEQDKHHFEEARHPLAMPRYVKRHYYVWRNRPAFFVAQ